MSFPVLAKQLIARQQMVHRRTRQLSRFSGAKDVQPKSVYFLVHHDFCDHILFFEDGHFKHGSHFAFGGSDGHGTWHLDEELSLVWSGGSLDVKLQANGRGFSNSIDISMELVDGEALAPTVQHAKARGLVFSSVGTQCLAVVQTWLESPPDFDLALVFYKDATLPVFEQLQAFSKKFPGVALYQHEGMKWPNFRYWLELQGGAEVVAARYDYIWVVDDDVRLPTREISRMFEILRDHAQIAFACPSFDKDSEGVWRFFDGHDPRWKLRYTNFVECTAPVLKSSMLLDSRFQPCLRAVRTGCFIDFCFHPAAGGGSNVVAVIDAIQCHHPRRTADYPSEMRQVQDWQEHKNDDVFFEKEGVPKEWWAIEPRFFQPKVLGAIPASGRP